MQNKKEDLRSERLNREASQRLKDKYFKKFIGETFDITYIEEKINLRKRNFYVKGFLFMPFEVFKKHSQINDLPLTVTLSLTNEKGKNGNDITLYYYPKEDKLNIYDQVNGSHSSELKDYTEIYFDAKGVNIILKIIAAYRLMLKEVFENTELEQTFSEPSQITKSYFPRS